MNLPLASLAIIVAAVTTPPPLDRIEEAAERHDFEWFGLNVADARKKAVESDLPFRVIKVDGNYLPITKDHRPGRINAHVITDKIVAIQIEGQSHSIVEGVIDLSHLSFLGLSEEEAIAHAKLHGLPFRIVIRNGRSYGVTMDYIKNRANAVIVDGKIIAITTG